MSESSYKGPTFNPNANRAPKVKAIVTAESIRAGRESMRKKLIVGGKSPAEANRIVERATRRYISGEASTDN